MKHAIGPRKEIGVRTIFNILGPMTNPAGANVQLTGVFSKDLTETLAQVLVRLGMKRTLVVWGEGNLDEMTITGTTHIAEGKDGAVSTFSITPEELGFERASLDQIKGGDTAEQAAVLVKAVLGGEPGPRLDMVLLNSSGALLAAGLVNDLTEGVSVARQLIESGKAMNKLQDLVAFSTQK
jgi:anthranilate phosphoribosyltransferase